MQTRVYETGDEAFVLAAAVGVLQDLGYNLDESVPALGIIVASQERGIPPPSMRSKIAGLGGKAAGAGLQLFGALLGSIINGAVDQAVGSDSDPEEAHEEWHERQEEEEVEEVERYPVKEQIRVSLVTRPHGDTANGRMTVRLTFQRIVWNNLGEESWFESLVSADVYKEFFAKLDQAVFLEAHQV